MDSITAPMGRRAAPLVASALGLLALFAGCNNKNGGGILGSLNSPSQDDTTEIDPLALPTATQPTGPAADADRAIRAWIRDALAASVRIDVKTTDAARTIIVDLPGMPPLPADVFLVWSFGDGETRGGAPSQHTYASGGTYQIVAALVHRLTGAIQFDSATFTVADGIPGTSSPPPATPPPVTAVAVVTPISGIAPLVVTFDATLSTGDGRSALSYDWNFGDGFHSAQPKVSHTYTDAGRFTVVLTVSNSFGDSASSQLVVTVDSPVVNNPPTPPQAPAPVRTFNGLVADGGYRLSGGVGTTYGRDDAIAAMVPLGRYGFRRWATTQYMGIARSIADASGYFAPLIAAGQANGIKFVPGFWLHHIIDNLYGVPTDPPWNVTGPNADLHHPMNPTAVLQQAFWDEVVTRASILARGAQSDQVFIDGEYVYWQTQDDPLWASDSNLTSIAGMLRNAVQRLADQGIFLVVYHPVANPYLPVMDHTARMLLSPTSATDPRRQVEHFVPWPYFSSASYVLPTPPTIDQIYGAAGFNLAHVCYGFTSDSDPHGFLPSDYDTYCSVTWPGIADKTWYYCVQVTTEAQRFGALRP